MSALVRLALCAILFGCGGEPNPGAMCGVESECAAPLVCELDRCRQTCVDSRDCDGELTCLAVSDLINVCQIEGEAACTLASDCSSGLECRSGTCAVPMARAPLIAAGLEHACAYAGTPAEMRCWGWNMFGQLGDTTIEMDRPTAVSVMGVSDVTIVASGARHSCAATSAGSLFCWGDNSSGQLGSTEVGPLPTPTMVSGLAGVVTDLSLGIAHSCAIADAQLYCWGDNSDGQLGDGTRDQRTSPTPVLLPATPVQVSTHANSTCVVLDDGDVSCFGDNSTGQAGSGEPGDADVLTPTAVVGLGPATQVAVGSAHACAVEITGDVKCWGARDTGQCGDIGLVGLGPYPPRASALAVLPEIEGPVLQIAAGSAHVCARTASQLYCWGDNFYGQAGVSGMVLGVGQPTEVTAVGRVDEVALGGTHTCFLQPPDASAFCFGRNNRGQLGDGMAGTDRFMPMQVSFP